MKLSIASFVLFVMGLLCVVGTFVLESAVGGDQSPLMVFGILFMVLSVVAGILSWREKLAKFVVVTACVILLWGFVTYFFAKAPTG